MFNIYKIANTNYNFTKEIEKNITISKPIAIPKNAEESIRLTIRDIKKEYTDPLNIPNFLSLFHLPTDTIRYYKALKEAHFHKENENIFEAKMKLCNTATNAAYSFSAIANTLTIFQELSAIGKTFPFIGIIASTISGVVEVYGIARQHRFISRCKKSLEKLKKDPNDLSAFDSLQKFIPNSFEVNKMQLIHLSKRLKPWFAEKIALEMPDALERKDLTKAAELLKNAKIQAQKTMIRHAISLTCNLFILGACVGLMVGAPYLIPLILFGCVCIAYTANYGFGRGTDQIGWKFRLEPCLFFWKEYPHT